MKLKNKLLVCVAIALTLATTLKAQEEVRPTWQSINERGYPEWFSDAKLGIFIHWGVYSVPAYAGYDRNDDGSRISYGLNWSSYGNIMGRTSAFIAQRYQLTDSSFMKAIGDDEKFSDYVGRIYASPHKYLDLN